MRLLWCDFFLNNRINNFECCLHYKNGIKEFSNTAKVPLIIYNVLSYIGYIVIFIIGIKYNSLVFGKAFIIASIVCFLIHFVIHLYLHKKLNLKAIEIKKEEVLSNNTILQLDNIIEEIKNIEINLPNTDFETYIDSLNELELPGLSGTKIIKFFNDYFTYGKKHITYKNISNVDIQMAEFTNNIIVSLKYNGEEIKIWFTPDYVNIAKQTYIIFKTIINYLNYK